MNEAPPRAGTPGLRYGARTDRGLVRSMNEDSYLVDRKLGLFVVCDGMGGHAAGRVASSLAVNAIREELLAASQTLAELTPDAVRTLLAVAVERVCQRVYERGQQSLAERGMGTTLTLLLVQGLRAYIAHVGDSRAYIQRDGALHQLTEDHSLLNEMLESGRVRSAAEVPDHYRNAVTRAIGAHSNVSVDTLSIELIGGDRFLLCSDGLFGFASEAAISEVLNGAAEEEEACERLVQLALDGGGGDNVTAVVSTVLATGEDHDRAVRETMDLLGRTPIFRELGYGELLRLSTAVERRSFPDGDAMFRRGDRERCVYMILSGRVRILHQNVTVAVLEAGEYFGELSLIDNAPHFADAIAVGDVRLLRLSRDLFFERMRESRGLAVKLLFGFVRALTARLRLTSNELTMLRTVFNSLPSGALEQLTSGWYAAPARPTATPPPLPPVPKETS